MKKFLLMLLLMGCASKEVKQKEPSFPVDVAIVQQKTVPFFLETIGHVEPIITVDISSRVQGEITNVYFTEGDYVKEGDLLFTIDPRSFQAEVKKNEGLLEEDVVNLKLAQEKVERYRLLAQEEYFSQLDYDSLLTNENALKASIKQAEADLENSKVNLSYCWIYSPLEGRTGIIQVDQGNMVTGNDRENLVTINQMKPIYVTFSFPEKDLARIRSFAKNDSLVTHATFTDFSKDFFTGKLRMIDNMVEAETGMVKLRALFDNEKENLWPKQFCRIRLILDQIKDALVVPYDAIVITSTGDYVFVVKEDNTVDFRPIELGHRIDKEIVITKGLKPGEKVVIEGQINLFASAKVEIRE